MDVTQMHLAIQQGVDKINSLQADLLLPEEIDLELNKAQSKFINLKYGINNRYRKGFEQSQKRIDDLRVLVEEDTITATFKEQLTNTTWVDTIELPDEYMYMLNAISKVYIEDCVTLPYTESGGIRVPDSNTVSSVFGINKFVQQDDIFTLLLDPFNTTTYVKPLMTFRENAIDIYTSDIFIIEEVKLTYLREPTEISLSLTSDCELPVHTHNEIVDMVVASILEGISDPRYKTHQIEVNKNE
jgi:hypothetical protein